MIAVLAVTAVLVAQPPARASLIEPQGPVSVDTRVGPYELNLVADPASAGVNTIVLSLVDRSGRPAKVAAVKVAARLTSKRIGPLRFEARRLSPGRFAVRNAQLPFPGDWQLRVSVRTGEFDLDEQTVSMPIRKAQR
jgi:copper transport protein